MGDDLEGDLSPASGPLYRLPRPWWHYLFPSLLALFWFSIAAAVEWSLLQPGAVTYKDRFGQHRTSSPADRWPMIALWGVVLVLSPVLPISYALTSPLVIRKHGLELGLRDRRGAPLIRSAPLVLQWFSDVARSFSRLRRWEFRITTWEQIGPCHWGRYNPGTLTVPGPQGLLFFKIPERDRAEVEAIFRRFGKWEA